jgi:hypothetical protein
MRNESTARPRKGIRLDKKVFNIAFQTYSAVTELYRLPGNVLSNAHRTEINEWAAANLPLCTSSYFVDAD